MNKKMFPICCSSVHLFCRLEFTKLLKGGQPFVKKLMLERETLRHALKIWNTHAAALWVVQIGNIGWDMST